MATAIALVLNRTQDFGSCCDRLFHLPFADTLKYAAGVVPSDFLKAAIKALGVL
jgi:hypothetical protein